ncbi:hypothetical protein OWM54_42885 [Myxococcus sp. MISCRS1]|uniref:hypothetical protein n=1 Tax=Myxococcus sp. MISCRS1 TaxID=2996786 RepID=UPI00226D80AE|nr:hypothetical protein [Myxococcus sp. MISCRS1]MCY1003911.1 hypothetical protein [Myxococcus sp. MISCRS1]
MQLRLEASASSFHDYSVEGVMAEKKSHPIPKPPAWFKPEEGCYAPGLQTPRCGNLNLVAKGLCPTHYSQARWQGDLTAPRPRAEMPANSFRAHGLVWTSKKAAMAVTAIAKERGISESELIASTVEEAFGLGPKSKRKAAANEG